MVAPARLWLTITWKGDVLYAASLARGQSFRLGSKRGDWPFPAQFIGQATLVLADYRDPIPQIWQPEGPRALLPGQRVETHFGAFCFATRLGTDEEEGVGWRRQFWEVRPVLHWVGSAVAHLSLLATMFYASPALTEVEPLRVKAPEPWLIVPFLDGATIVPEEGEASPSIATMDSLYLERIPGQPMRCSGYGMGMQHPTQVGRYAVMGPTDNPDPHLSRTRPIEKHPPIAVELLGIENPAEIGDAKAPTAPWGRDTSLGTDEVSARGNMWGEEIGDGPGNDDLADESIDGGFLKRIEISRTPLLAQSRLAAESLPLPARPAPLEIRPARVIHTRASVSGSIRLSDAEFAVAPQLPAFRNCYFADASSHGDHEGHVELAFVVESTGAVKDVTASKGNGVEPTLIDCVLSRAKELTFPRASDESHITYPIHFIPGFEPASAKVRPIPLAPFVERERHTSSPCTGTRPGQAKRLQPCSR